MIFRLKQHAMGLANITLLAVMAFVTIATTTALHTGMSYLTDSIYPKNTSISYTVADRQEGEHYFSQTILSHLPQKADNAITYLVFQAGIDYNGGDTILISDTTLQQPNYFSLFITQDDFRKLGNDLPQLSSNQVAFFLPNQSAIAKTMMLGDKEFEVVSNLSHAILPDSINTVNSAIIIVSDDSLLAELKDYFAQANVTGYLTEMTYRAFIDTTSEEEALLYPANGETHDLVDDRGEVVGSLIYKQEFQQVLLGFTGGFLFTGMLLGISFLLGAAIIIYYKQYTEGQADQESYHILQEVGMSQKMVQKTINSQVLVVFFMPLVMATIHFIFSLVIIKQLLSIFNVTSSSIIYIVSGGTVVGISLFYYLIYKWTSRIYYRMIER